MKIQFTAAAVAAALLASTSPALALTQYRITDLGLAPGTESTVARAISANGAIAGEAGGQGANAGYRLDGGITPLASIAGATNFVTRGVNNAGVAAATVQGVTSNDIAVLASTAAAVQLANLGGYAAGGALDINNNGVAVGYSQVSGTNAGIEGNLPLLSNAAGTQTAVIWSSNGTVTQLTAPANFNSMAVANNDAGQVAGMYRLANNRIQGVVWDSNGVASTLANPVGQSQARVRAISENGWIAGQTSGTLGFLATVWSPTSTYLLPSLGTTATIVTTTRGINSSGLVVGFSQSFDDTTGDQVGQNHTLWEYGGGSFTAYDLSTLIVNFAGWDFGTGAAQAINDNGDIVGFATAADGFQHGYLLTAVPEPASWAMLITGFGLVGGALRRRRTAIA